MKDYGFAELKQNLGSIINQASYGRERIVLLSHGKERAALISIEDYRLFEALLKENKRETAQTKQLNLLNEARQLRERLGESGYHVDSTSILEDTREERLDDLTYI